MPFKRLLKDERGVILVITLLIIALLIGAGAGAMTLVQTDLKISANLKNGTQAFYLAEAGIEWAKQQVKDAAANPPSPSDDSESLSPGSFSVVFSNPTIQSQLAGVVTAESTGTVGSSSSKIRALLKKTYELSDGAISVRGTEASSNFTGNSFVVDGRDYDPASGTLVVGAKAQYGISVSNSTLEGQVEGALSSPQEDNVVGKGGSTPDVEQSGFLPTDEVEELANNLCRAAGTIVQNISSGGTLSITGNNTYGTTAAPELRCFTGLGSGETVDIGGNFTGVGVLVVRNAELIASEAFHWEGLVLVSGTNVGFSFSGGGNKDIYGSVMINERGTDSGDELDLQGAVNIRFSSSALVTAVELFPLSALEPIYGSIPSSLEQIYWRTVTD